MALLVCAFAFTANRLHALQWGFTPLHYATVSRKKEAINMLLSAGASASIAAKSGLTARDLAEELHFDDIVDALTSKINIQNGTLLCSLSFSALIASSRSDSTEVQGMAEPHRWRRVSARFPGCWL